MLFSLKAEDPLNKAISFRWILNDDIVATDSFFQFIPGLDSVYNLLGLVFNNSDTSVIRWKINIIRLQNIPSTPVLGSPANNSGSVPLQTVLKWNISSGAEFYNLQVSEDEGFSTYIKNEIVPDTLYQISLTSAGTTYFWRVRGSNSIGSSQFSDPWKFTTTLSLPAEVVLVNPEKNQKNVPLNVRFSWRVSDNADRYRFQVSSDKQFRIIIYEDSLLNIYDTTKTINILQTKKSYWWRVYAQNSSGEVLSEVRMFTTGISSIFPGAAYRIPSGNENNIRLTWNSDEAYPGDILRYSDKS
jgi:hypothetical protein